MKTPIDSAAAYEFLTQGRIAVVGASDDRKNFGCAVYRELKTHGLSVVPVNRTAETVDGDKCYATVAGVPGELDGVLVMVNRGGAADVVRECIDRGVPRVWLFKGIGGASAVSDEAVEMCKSNGVTVIPGACPLMFLEPVGGMHKFHRGMRHLNGSLSKPVKLAS
jgi:predicted CoA-binding protein